MSPRAAALRPAATPFFFFGFTRPFCLFFDGAALRLPSRNVHPRSRGSFAPMRFPLLALSVLLLASALVPSASATCVMEEHVIDPVKRDTGTPVDLVVIRYYETRCHPPPHDESPYQ